MAHSECIQEPALFSKTGPMHSAQASAAGRSRFHSQVGSVPPESSNLLSGAWQLSVQHPRTMGIDQILAFQAQRLAEVAARRQHITGLQPQLELTEVPTTADTAGP